MNIPNPPTLPAPPKMPVVGDAIDVVLERNVITDGKRILDAFASGGLTAGFAAIQRYNPITAGVEFVNRTTASLPAPPFPGMR